MKKLLKILQNKYFLYVVIAVIISLGFKMSSCQNNENEELQTYNRQLSGQLSDQERELQGANYELGISESKLTTQKDLADILKTENEEKDKKFDEFVKKHNLQVQSRDTTIARLKQKIKGGTTTVVVSEDHERCIDLDKYCKIGYDWRLDDRFVLQDPNIFEPGDEIFESNQLFRVHGEIYQQDDSSLQIRRLLLREVYLDDDGEYQPIEDAKAEIVDSEFVYSNPPSIEKESSWTDIFVLHPITLSSIKIMPNTGSIELGIGVEVLRFAGFGLNTHTSFNFNDLKYTAQYLGISYVPTFFNKELNFGLGVAAGSPFYRFGREFGFKVDLLFYLW